MRRLEEMSGGLWRPGPGSIHPHLQLLEDEGVVESAEHDGTRTFTLTDEGAAEAARSK
jgi:DNA-binding PadR family transcriptional regulator